MLRVVRTNRFKKDYKLLLKQRKEIRKLDEIMIKLTKQEQLNEIFKDHKLKGNYIGRRECHVESDWILIYKVENGEIIFERTGSHSELFE